MKENYGKVWIQRFEELKMYNFNYEDRLEIEMMLKDDLIILIKKNIDEYRI